METVLAKRNSKGAKSGGAARHFIVETLQTILFVVVVVVAFRTVAFANYHIPSESMLPGLEVGDRIMVSKFRYGYSRHSLPLSLAPSFPTQTGRVLGGMPGRGDVVVFKHPLTGEDYIKRVVGLPGDHIQLVGGRLAINGQLVQRLKRRTYRYREYDHDVIQVHEYLEVFPEGSEHIIIERSDHGPADATQTYTVPAGHLFMMGDNRDNSTDSRYLNQMGYVPIENVVGRAEIIAFTFHACRDEPGLYCRDTRFLHAIR